MDVNDYQEWGADLDKYTEAILEFDSSAHQDERVAWMKLACCALQLNSEAGEAAGIVSKALRDSKGKLTAEALEKLILELGDCSWYISAIARELKTPMRLVLANNIAKLESRRERGTLGGSGDLR